MSGAAAWLAITTNVNLGPVNLGFGLFDMNQGETLAGAIVCAGAAMLPDADHQSATIARSLPPISNVVTKVVATVSGGHRNGTHSIIGILAIALLAWIADKWSMDTAAFGVVYPGAAVLAVLLISFAVKTMKFMPAVFCWVIALAGAGFVGVNAPDERSWFFLAVVLGAAVHIVGDMLTIGGVNWLWPIKIKAPRWFRRLPVIGGCWKANGRIAVPVLGETGSNAEWVLASALTSYVVVALLVA